MWSGNWLEYFVVLLKSDGSTLLKLSLYCRFTLNNSTILFAPCFNVFICFYYPGGFISKRLSETLSFSRKNVRKGLYLIFFINSFILSFIYLFIHLFIYSLVHWFVDLFIHSVIHWCIDSWISFITLNN